MLKTQSRGQGAGSGGRLYGIVVGPLSVAVA